MAGLHPRIFVLWEVRKYDIHLYGGIYAAIDSEFWSTDSSAASSKGWVERRLEGYLVGQGMNANNLELVRRLYAVCSKQLGTGVRTAVENTAEVCGKKWWMKNWTWAGSTHLQTRRPTRSWGASQEGCPARAREVFVPLCITKEKLEWWRKSTAVHSPSHHWLLFPDRTSKVSYEMAVRLPFPRIYVISFFHGIQTLHALTPNLKRSFVQWRKFQKEPVMDRY